MKKTFLKLCLLLAVATVPGLILGSVSGCELFTKKNARTVLDVSKYACIIANAHLDNALVAKTCDVLDDAKPALDELLKQHRFAMAMAGKPLCAPAPSASASGGK